MDVILYFRPAAKAYSKPEKLVGVREIAEKARFHVQVIDERPTRERLRDLFGFWNFKGAIVECGGREEHVDPRIFGDWPVVFFNHNLNSLPGRCLAVSHDSKSTGILAARELLLADRQHFAYVRAPGDPFWCREREQGFSQALALNGRTCTVLAWPRGEHSATDRTRRLQSFLRSLPKSCAVFAANDSIAAEVITAAQLSGIAIPEDVAVLGVDNTTEVCEHTSPTLSSIEPDFRKGGNLAMMTLLAALHGGPHSLDTGRRTFGDLRVVRRLSTHRLQHADALVANALNLIRRNACSGLTAAEVARTFPCSRRMADLRFVRSVGHTMLDEIHAVRLERAKQLLLDPNQVLKSISDFCGFENPNSLRKFFRKETGMTLSEWRKAHPRCISFPDEVRDISRRNRHSSIHRETSGTCPV